jgi:polyhydroxybutyrate depolymerase
VLLAGSVRLRRAALLLIAFGLGSAVMAAPVVREEHLETGSITRHYLLHIPDLADASKPLPLVLLLHGRGGSGKAIHGYSDFGAKADKEGFLLACPDASGTPPAWNSGAYASRSYPADDVAFLHTLLDTLEKRHRVDPRRIFVAGHSSGGMMSHRLGSELADRVAAIGVVAGSIGAQLADGTSDRLTAPTKPISVILFHGKADRIVPYDGGGQMLRFLPVSDATAFWIRSTGCGTEARKEQLAEGAAMQETYTGGKEGTEVVLITTTHGGHEWPKAAGMQATDLMWDFFKAHPKPANPAR